jgi:glucose/mannose transport system substrate-binding protein
VTLSLAWVRFARRLAGGVALASLALLSETQAATTPAAPRPRPKQLTILHWWTSPAESAALNALVKLFSATYPGVTVKAVPATRGGSLQSVFTQIMKEQSGGHMPDSFPMYAGTAAEVFFDAGLLSPIDDLWAEEKLEAVIPRVIRDLNKIDGHYYSVPINVHRTNLVWYNKPLLDKHGIDPDKLTTWDAFFGAAETLRHAGVKSPIQMGPTWTAKGVFEGIMAGQGVSVYEDWINGKLTAADSPELTRAWTTFQRYLAYVNPDHDAIAWDVAIGRVKKGEGAFCVMGDWADGEFRIAGLKYGKDYGKLLVPGTKGMFGVGVDTFQHPSGLADPANSLRWLRLVASRKGQDVFNPLKGSISARSDSDPARYEAYQRSAMEDWKSVPYLYPWLGSGLPDAFNNHLLHDLDAFMADQDVAAATAAVASAARQLPGRHRRVWRLTVR